MGRRPNLSTIFANLTPKSIPKLTQASLLGGSPRGGAGGILEFPPPKWCNILLFNRIAPLSPLLVNATCGVTRTRNHNKNYINTIKLDTHPHYYFELMQLERVLVLGISNFAPRDDPQAHHPPLKMNFGGVLINEISLKNSFWSR